MASAAIPLIIGGAGILANLFGNRGQQMTQQQRSSGQQNDAWTNYLRNISYGGSSPVYDESAWNYRNDLLQNALDRFKNFQFQDPGQLARSITTQNVQGLNTEADFTQRALNSALRQRGLSSSPMGAYASAVGEGDRIRRAIGFMNQTPLLERQFGIENENLFNTRQQLAQQLFSMLPYGQSYSNFGDQFSEGTSESRRMGEMIGSSTSPGNMLGGLSSGIGSAAILWDLLRRRGGGIGGILGGGDGGSSWND